MSRTFIACISEMITGTRIIFEFDLNALIVVYLLYRKKLQKIIKRLVSLITTDHK